MVTLQRLQDLFDYDPLSGLLTWKVKKQRVKAGQEAGALTRSGHVRVKIDGKSYMAHRIIWLLWYGTEPAALLDHRDGDPTNNRIANLRLATKAQNGQNRPDALGVCFYPATGKWRAYITHQGKTRHLGVFESLESALGARRAAMRDLWTHSAQNADGGAHRRYGLAKN